MRRITTAYHYKVKLSKHKSIVPSRSWHKLTFLCWRAVKQQTNSSSPGAVHWRGGWGDGSASHLQRRRHRVDVSTPLSGGVIFETVANSLSFLARRGWRYLIPWDRMLSYTVSKKHGQCNSYSEADVAIGLNCSMLSVEIGSAHQKVRAHTAVRLPPTHALHAAIGFHMHAVVNRMLSQRRKPEL